MQKQKNEGDEMSEFVVDSVKWNTLSKEAQIKILEKHKATIKNDYFTEDGKPRCAICGQGMKPATDSQTGQISKYEWELNCKCIEEHPKLKDLRLCIG